MTQDDPQRVPSEVRMANDIASQFAYLDHDKAAQSIAAHLNTFWEPRMRARLLGLAREGGAGIAPLVIDALPGLHKGA